MKKGSRIKTALNLVVVFVLVFALPVLMYVGNRFAPDITQALFRNQGTYANLVINLTNASSQSSHSWSNLSQGGEEQGGMLSKVLDETKALEPRYIRIDHIYDFYDPVKRDAQGRLTYDWKRLDTEINDIRKTGATPFLSLSYMPKAISKGTEVDIPVSWNEWQEVVRATIEHVSGRNGLAISDVYYEVWNEPDLFGGFKTSGDKNYLTMYEFASYGAQNTRNTLPFKFGGPATTDLYETWFRSLLSTVEAKGLRMDFYSWHSYTPVLSDYETEITDAKTWLLSYPKLSNIELLITESGHTPEVDSKYDTTFSAVHTLGLYATTFQKIPKVFLFEIKDGPGPQAMWGRWGVLTHEKYGIPQKKPRYYAIQFLNKMKGDWYPIYGQGTWVKALATRSGDTIRLMIVNYDPEGKRSENVPISFVNIPFRKFKVVETQFLGGTIQVGGFDRTDVNWRTTSLLRPNSAKIIELQKVE